MDRDSRTRPLRDQAELRETLSLVLERADPDAAGLAYRLVGTAAALAQGVPLVAGDVDILVAHRSDVDTFSAALAGFPCPAPPAWITGARQYFARFTVEGVVVEVSTVERPAGTDTVECAGPGPWRHYVTIAVGTHLVPVVGLELRLVSELIRNRPDRYEPLIRHLRRHSGNLDLVRRSMRDRGVDPMLQQRVIEQLHRR
jgi:hypothetical protein